MTAPMFFKNIGSKILSYKEVLWLQVIYKTHKSNFNWATKLKSNFNWIKRNHRPKKTIYEVPDMVRERKIKAELNQNKSSEKKMRGREVKDQWSIHKRNRVRGKPTGDIRQS